MTGRLVIAARDGHLEEGADLQEEGKDRNEAGGRRQLEMQKSRRCQILLGPSPSPLPCGAGPKPGFPGISSGCSYQEQIRETTCTGGASSFPGSH